MGPFIFNGPSLPSRIAGFNRIDFLMKIIGFTTAVFYRTFLSVFFQVWGGSLCLSVTTLQPNDWRDVTCDFYVQPVLACTVDLNRRDLFPFNTVFPFRREEKRRKEKPPSMSLDPSVSSTPSPSEVLAPLHIGCAVVTGNESNKKKEMRFEVYTVFSSPVSLPIVSRPLQCLQLVWFHLKL